MMCTVCLATVITDAVAQINYVKFLNKVYITLDRLIVTVYVTWI